MVRVDRCQWTTDLTSNRVAIWDSFYHIKVKSNFILIFGDNAMKTNQSNLILIHDYVTVDILYSSLSLYL